MRSAPHERRVPSREAMRGRTNHRPRKTPISPSDSIKLIDDRIANPAYGLLLISGFGMVGVSHYPMRTPWLACALALYVVMALVAVFGYTPTLKGQIQALDRGGVTSPEYQGFSRRGRLLGALLGVVVIAIVFLMVVKPALWG